MSWSTFWASPEHLIAAKSRRSASTSESPRKSKHATKEASAPLLRGFLEESRSPTAAGDSEGSSKSSRPSAAASASFASAATVAASVTASSVAPSVAPTSAAPSPAGAVKCRHHESSALPPSPSLCGVVSTWARSAWARWSCIHRSSDPFDPSNPNPSSTASIARKLIRGSRCELPPCGFPRGLPWSGLARAWRTSCQMGGC